jgi:hypothetical protein
MFKKFLDCFRPSQEHNIDEVIIQLREVSNLLKQQISKYNSDMNMSRAVLKNSILKKESKTQKLYYLKRLKLLESHMKSTTDRLLAVDQQTLSLEAVKLSVKQFDAMKLTTKTLSHYMKQTDVDKIEDLQEKLSDYIADATEVSNIMNRNLDPDFDEDDLEKELEELSRDEGNSLNVSFPKAPTNGLYDVDLDDTTVSSPLIAKNSSALT